MKIWINIKCSCGIRYVPFPNMTKKKFVGDVYFVDCDVCGERCEIINIKNDREIKIDNLMIKIKEYV